MLPKSKMAGRCSFADSRKSSLSSQPQFDYKWYWHETQTLVYPYKHQEIGKEQSEEAFVNEQNKLTPKTGVDHASQRPLDQDRHHVCLPQLSMRIKPEEIVPFH